MKAQALREMTLGELGQQLEELYHEQFNLRFQSASQQLDNTARVGQVRRDIARVKTIMTELERAQAAQEEVE
jgi:large subunit ribosomal protein L29